MVVVRTMVHNEIKIRLKKWVGFLSGMMSLRWAFNAYGGNTSKLEQSHFKRCTTILNVARQIKLLLLVWTGRLVWMLLFTGKFWRGRVTGWALQSKNVPLMSLSFKSLLPTLLWGTNWVGGFILQRLSRESFSSRQFIRLAEERRSLGSTPPSPPSLVSLNTSRGCSHSPPALLPLPYLQLFSSPLYL